MSEKNGFEKTQPDKNLKIQCVDISSFKNIKRKDIQSGFILENFFSEKECDIYLEQLEDISFKSLDKEYPESYRNSERICLFNQDIATVIWSRLVPFLTKKDIHNQRPIDFNNEGVWRPIRVNECLKITRYKPNSYFKPHLDGLYIPDPNEATIHTILIYLNDDFSGGNTNFIKIPKDQDLVSFLKDPKGKYEVMESIKAKKGSALIFSSDKCHEGETVLKGNKFILRSEIVFQRTNNDQIDFKFVEDINFLKMWEYYDMTVKALIDNESPEKVTELYLKAINIQYQHVIKQKENLSIIPEEIILKICEFLEPKNFLHMKLVNKNWNYTIIQAYFWELMMKKNYSKFYDLHLKEFKGNTDIGDWYQIYKKHFILDVKKPMILKFADTKISFIKEVNLFDKNIQELSPHYSIKTTYGWYGKKTHIDFSSKYPHTLVEDGLYFKDSDSYKVLEYIINHRFKVYQLRPLVIPCPPLIYKRSKESLFEEFTKMGFLPYSLLFVDSALLLIYNSLKSSGVVFYRAKGSEEYTVTIVIDYEIILQEEKPCDVDAFEFLPKILKKIETNHHTILKKNILLYENKASDVDEMIGAIHFIGSDQYLKMRSSLKKQYKDRINPKDVEGKKLKFQNSF